MSSRILNNWARVASTKPVAIPTRAIAHIQNTAPGPPSVIATATPATLPVPTRAAREVQSAWNEEIPESSDWRLPLSTLKV
ncbi:Uncharacterised protein [Klebsiella pneumoniae]|nr:Uncharacterised protein [Klebsiella pneumoniae]